ncbi:MAG: hypothetical protein JST92_23500, partial [Deltaproteobacteria bacterium]|nr:hypothetical protein [Deltaproteobacteria bacterium]
KAFVDDAAVDPLARRTYLYERWLDKWTTVEGQVVERRHTTPMTPADPESKWSDEQYLEAWDDYGDSANWTGHAAIAATFRYAVTGADADYARMLKFVNADLLDFEATGMDGYLARFNMAAVPPGTKIRNGYAMVERAFDDTGRFDIPANKLSLFPAYYTQGIPTADGTTTTPSRPSWDGHVSIDAYSGPWNSFPLAYPLVKDPVVKEAMARHFTCSLKRLRIARVINLSQNTTLRDEIGAYLTSGTYTPDADEPDLTKLDEVWAFYLPQYNVNSAATYPRDCPATMATEPELTIDVTQPGYEGKLLLFFLRQGDGDKSDGIDFGFYPSARAGDAVMLDDYALAAYQMTYDPQYLTWRDQVLFGKAKAKDVERTVGAFHIPKACSDYFRLQNVYTAHLARLLTDNDPESRAFAQYIWSKKYEAKEESTLRDSMFEILYAGTTGQSSARLTDALAEIASLGGTKDALETPRRNYDLDNEADPPPGITVSAPSQADVDLCTAGVTLLGIHIPGSTPDPAARYADPALPVMRRPTQCFMWEKDPFSAKRVRGAGESGRQMYEGLDLSMPYWFGRYFGLIADPHVVLAWGP